MPAIAYWGRIHLDTYRKNPVTTGTRVIVSVAKFCVTQCVDTALDIHGVMLSPTTGNASGTGSEDRVDVPMCFLPVSALDHLVVQLCTVLVQQGDFAALTHNMASLLAHCKTHSSPVPRHVCRATFFM